MIVEQGFRIFLRSVMSISLLISLRAISLERLTDQCTDLFIVAAAAVEIRSDCKGVYGLGRFV